MNQSEKERLYFGKCFNDSLVEKGTPFAARKPSTPHWYEVAIGMTNVHVSLILVNREGHVGVEFYMRDKRKKYDYLLAHKEELEKELGVDIERLNDEEKKCSRILHKIYGLDFNNHEK